MTAEPPLIGYAPPGLDPSADRLLRRIIGWFAILFGGQALATKALHLGLAKGWLAHPPNMSWSIDHQWEALFMAAGSLLMVATVLGGVLLLRRSPTSVFLLRAGAAGSIVLTVVGTAMHLRTNTILASYWSTPATAAFNSLQLLDALWLPVLVLLLTLPPLARRMV